MSSIDSSVPAAVVLTFTFNIGSIISIGDKAYHGNTPTFAGTVVATTTNTITIDTTIGGSVPPGGAFICYIKDSVAESHGVRGHYLEFTLTNTDTVARELFAVKSSMFKSYP